MNPPLKPLPPLEPHARGAWAEPVTASAGPHANVILWVDIQLDARVTPRPARGLELLRPDVWHGAAALTVVDDGGQAMSLLVGVCKTSDDTWACAWLSATGQALAAPVQWTFDPHSGLPIEGPTQVRLRWPGGAGLGLTLACRRLQQTGAPFALVQVTPDGAPYDMPALMTAARGGLAS